MQHNLTVPYLDFDVIQNQAEEFRKQFSKTGIPVLSFAARAMSRGLHISLIAKPELLTTQEAAEMIACSRQHIVDLINEGKLKATSIGTHRRIKLDDVLGFIEQEDKERDVAMASLIAHTEEIGGYDLK